MNVGMEESHDAREATNVASSVPGLEIARIEVIPLLAPLAREFKGSFYRMTKRATVITRVHTVEGIVGEAYVGDEDESLGTLVAIAENEIGPSLVGSSPFLWCNS